MQKIRHLITLGVFFILINGIFSLSFSDNTSMSPARVNGEGITSEDMTEGASQESNDSMQDELEAFGPDVPSVEVPSELQRLIGVKKVKVIKNTMRRRIRTIGRVTIDERKLTTINIKYEGWIEKLYADYTGQYVERGEPLVKIWSPEATSVQLEYLNLLKWKEGQIPRFQRIIEFDWGDRYGTIGKFVSYDPELLVEVAKQKFQLWEFTEAEIEQIEKNRKPFERMTIKSPVNGFIYQKPVFEGTRVAPGDKIFDIVDLSTVWVLADLYEYEIPFIKLGQPANISLSYFPDKNFTSHVEFIYPTLSGQTRTVKARFIIDNSDLFLKPDMFADVDMKIDLGERLAIPVEAVLDTGTRQIVYVDIGDGYFEPRKVQTGVKTHDMVEITSGLKSGEIVVARPVFLIDSEAKLKGIVQ